MNGDLECHPLDDSLASIQSLKEASGCAGAALPRPTEQTPGPEKENWRPQVGCSFLSPGPVGAFQ